MKGFCVPSREKFGARSSTGSADDRGGESGKRVGLEEISIPTIDDGSISRETVGVQVRPSGPTVTRRGRRRTRRATTVIQQPGSAGLTCEAEPSSSHGEPPFEVRPRRPLSRRLSPTQDPSTCSGTRCSASAWSQSETVRSKPSLPSHAGRLSRVSWPGPCVRRRAHDSHSGGGRDTGGTWLVRIGIRSVGRDRRQRQVEVVMQDDDRPLLGLKTSEAAFELLAVGDLRRRRRRWRAGSRCR